MFNFEEEYDWAGLVACCQPTGPEWLEEYRKGPGTLTRSILEALMLFRRRSLEEGRLLLETTRRGWLAMEARDPVSFHVVGRFYHGCEAYYYYCIERLDEAERIMEMARNSIRLAIEANRALLPFAALAMDVFLKRAQIAREQRNWQELSNRITIVRDVIADKRPLFILGDDHPVYHQTLWEFLRPMKSPQEKYPRATEYLRDGEMRRRTIEPIALSMYRIPGFVIPRP